jgi:tetratricopeptide (TPR) repeat protein
MLLPARAALADDTAEARAIYERGLQHYNKGDLDEAIGDFREALARTQAPKLLFNLAQAYRLKKEWALALEHYEIYLRKLPDAKNREDVLTRIGEMRMRMAASAPAKPPEPTPPPEPSPPEPEPRPRPQPEATPPKQPEPPRGPSPRGRAQRVVGLTLVGLGAASLGGAIAASPIANAAASELRDLTARGGAWGSDAAATNDRRLQAQNAALALYPIAAVALAAGTVVAVLGFRSSPAERSP